MYVYMFVYIYIYKTEKTELCNYVLKNRNTTARNALLKVL